MTMIRVLGPIAAEGAHGEALDLGGPTQRRLLASLVARCGEVVAVTALLEELWGDDPPPSGPQSIQSYVSRLRGVLGTETIVTRAPGYQLRTDNVEIDSLVFSELASDLPAEPYERLTHIEEALDLWGGPAFEGFEAVEFETRRLTDVRLDLEEEKARLLAGFDRVGEAVASLQKLTADDPLRESSWLALAHILSAAGRQAEAIRTLDRYRASLADIGLEPGPDFAVAEAEVFETTKKPLSATLPRSETTFHGRRAEIDSLTDLLETSRLVTLTGPGGMGKSRLAIETLRSWGGMPIAVTRLAGLRADTEVSPAVLDSLGGESRGDPVEAIVTTVSRNPVLLLLDNAEHVIEATAGLASLLVARTEARLLVTSREPLNIQGETVLSIDSLEPEAAVALYRDRAAQVAPDFNADPETIELLCAKLDNMPLAIEMAASRSKALAPDEILSLLGREFGLLERPMRGGTGRHRNLDTLVEWSYDLLDPPTQAVFGRLSIFSGAFDIELARDVAGFGDVKDTAVPALVADLVEKSLLRRIGPREFRMLRVLRAFANQKLVASDDSSQTRSRHAGAMANLAREIGDGLSTPEEMTWIKRANRSVDDLGAALSWSIESQDPETAQKILEGLFDWFYHRQPPAIVDWGERALPIADGHALGAVAGAWASLAALKRGDLAAAEDLAERGTKTGDEAARFAWFMVGEVACYDDRLEDALDAYRRQLGRASKLGDPIGVVDAMAGETLALSFQGVFDRAADIATDLERVASDIGAPTYRAYARYAYGEAILQADPAKAVASLEEAADLAASVNNQYIEAMARTTLGSGMSQLRRHEDAVTHLHRAIELWETMGIPSYHWAAVQYLGAILAETGNPETATILLAAAEEAGRRPFTAGQSHWLAVVDDLSSYDRHDEWVERGTRLDLTDSTELALSSTRPRR